MKKYTSHIIFLLVIFGIISGYYLFSKQAHLEKMQLTKKQEQNMIVDVKWIWVATLMSDDTKNVTDEKKSFGIIFNKDGNMNVATDCNNGFGDYEFLENGKLKIGPLASTLMYCEGSQESLFFKQLQEVESYLHQNDKLYLQLKLDSGVMEFENVKN